MKTTLKFFWPVLLVQFFIQELVLITANKLSEGWLHLLIIGCLIFTFVMIHRFKNKI